MSRQMQNGKWDSLSNTATILVFLLLYMNGLKAVLKDSNEKELLDQVKERIDRGVTAIKIAYSAKNFNWENNIVTTANSLLVLFLYDESSEYKSKDFLKNFVDESRVAANYNALDLALHTLDVAIDDLNTSSNSLAVAENEIVKLQSDTRRLSKRLYITGMIAGFSVVCLLSICIQLALNVPNELVSIISEVFMWLPVAVGTVIPAVVFYVNKKVNKLGEIKKKSTKQRNSKRGK